MQFNSFEIMGPILVRGSVHRDGRGTFCETWRGDEFASNAITDTWVQDNLSVSSKAGTVRGLHWQIGPHAQAKLVRPIYGKIIDVAVDLRQGSISFGKAVTVELDSARNEQLYVPVGFAHGFCTLVAETIVMYKVSSNYAPAAERCLNWADRDLAINWQVDPLAAVLNEKDHNAPLLKQLTAQDLF